MSIQLTPAQLWLAHTPTELPEDSAAVIAAIVAEHKRFMAERVRNQEIANAPVQQSLVPLAACFQPVASDVTPREFHQAGRGRLAARLRVLRKGAGQ